MRSVLARYYSRQLFEPGWLAMFVNPFYFARLGLRAALRDLAHHVDGKLLDVGCGTRPYESLFNTSEYTGLELDTPHNRSVAKADVYYDGTQFPFEDHPFDTVLCNQVLEHVFEPEEFLQEIARVLKENGQLLLTVPFVWDEHEQPRDFARYSSFGLAALLKRNGFEVVEQRKTVADIRVVFQLINAYLYKKTASENPYTNLFFTVLLMSPFNLIGTVLGWLLPGNADLYLDNVVLAKKVSGQ
jgi:SAM-dependent methyltransferase